MAYKKHARSRSSKPLEDGRVRTRCSRLVPKEVTRVKLTARDPENCQRCATLTL